MSTSVGPNLGLFINGNEGEEHYEILMRQFRGFDGLIQCHVQSKSVATPPGGLSDGAMYIIPAEATGAWTARTGQLARSYTLGTGAPGWEYFLPKKGWSVRVEDEGDADGVPKVYVYTGTEWKVPAASGPAGMQNPMTTVGDIIVAGAGGVPTRLPIGSEGLVLKIIGGQLTWAEDATQQAQAGMTNPMTSPGDIIHGGVGGAPTRLARGTNGQMLSLIGGAPAWVDAPSGGGLTNPMTDIGDLIVGGTAGAPARLARGADGQVLKVLSGVLAWAAEAAGLANPMTTAGDIIVGGTAGAPQRLGKGADGQVLKIVAGVLAWAAEAGGMTNPMTTAGDLVIGGTSGAPARLGIGTNGQVLKVSGGVPTWVAESGGGGPANTDALAEGSTNLYFTAARVLATVLTGLVTTNNAAISATDTLLVALGKLQAQVTNKEGSIAGGTAAQYLNGLKSWVDFATSVRAAVLTGLSTSTATAVVATDSVLVGVGKLQAQVDARVPTSALGVTVATLVSGTVPASQLPSYVDDVLEYTNLAAFPATGETGKIYIALDTNRQYRWSGSAYIQLVASPGTTDAVAEGTTNLYFTTARVLATALAGLVTNNGTVVSASDTLLVAVGKLQAQVQARLALAGGKMTGALNYALPVQLASAATVAIGAAAAQTINITGTTTITAFDSIAAGARRRVVFDGILTLTHGATSLVLPGYANITTAVGDVAEFESLGSGNWRCTSYMKVNGRSIALGAPIPTVTAATNVNIYSPGVEVIKISGTAGIGYLGTGTVGQEVTVIFDSVTPLWGGNALILPVEGTLTTTPGDVAKFVFENTSGVSRCSSYQRASVADERRDLGLGTFATADYAAAPFVNLMSDSGRFAGRMNPLSQLASGSFTTSSLLGPYNGGTHSSAGKFIHNNTTYGGTAGNLTEPVTTLLVAMGRTGTGSDNRYGIEFYIDSYTAGNGTNAAASTGTDGVSRYLCLSNAGQAIFQASNTCTFIGWIRVRNLAIHIPFASYRNGSTTLTPAFTPITTTDGWVHLRVVSSNRVGYNSAYPQFYATNGTIFEIACPAFFGGLVDVGLHTNPLPTINELSA